MMRLLYTLTYIPKCDIIITRCHCTVTVRGIVLERFPELEMYMFGKKIELTESNLVAMDAVRQALEVLLGQTIRFAYLKIKPGNTYMVSQRDGIMEKLSTTIEGGIELVIRDPTDAMKGFFVKRKFSFVIDLLKKSSGSPWQPHCDLANRLIISENSYIARWGINDCTEEIVSVISETQSSKGSFWWVGTTLHDRRQVPLYKKEQKLAMKA